VWIGNDLVEKPTDNRQVLPLLSARLTLFPGDRLVVGPRALCLYRAGADDWFIGFGSNGAFLPRRLRSPMIQKKAPPVEAGRVTVGILGTGVSSLGHYRVSDSSVDDCLVSDTGLRYPQEVDAVRGRSPIPLLAALPLHGQARRIAQLDPDRAWTGSIGAADVKFEQKVANMSRTRLRGVFGSPRIRLSDSIRLVIRRPPEGLT
jgi:hypothetical protein